MIDISKSPRLEIYNMNGFDSDQLLTKFIQLVLSFSSIYHLKFSSYIIIVFLVQVLHLLTEVDSLKIFRILSDHMPNFHFEEDPFWLSMVMNNLILLCPLMSYLKLNFIDGKNIELFWQYFLKDVNRFRKDFCSLSFRVPALDNQMIKSLQDNHWWWRFIDWFSIKTCTWSNIFIMEINWLVFYFIRIR